MGRYAWLSNLWSIFKVGETLKLEAGGSFQTSAKNSIRWQRITDYKTEFVTDYYHALFITLNIKKSFRKKLIIWWAWLCYKCVLYAVYRRCLVQISDMTSTNLWFFVVFLSPSKHMPAYQLKVDHTCCHPHPSHSLFTMIVIGHNILRATERFIK